MDTIRAPGIYFKGKRVAEIESNDYTISSGGESQHGTDGLLGYSSGHGMTKIVANTIIPVRGMSVDFVGSLLRRETVVVGWSGGGKLHQVEMKILEASFKGDSKAGSLKGTFNFEGGEPEVTG
jgi:hypothetical protein